MSKVDIWDRFLGYAMPEPNSGCWLWLGGIDKNGYGSFCASKLLGKVRAHRFAYERVRGPIPSGLVVDHLCGVAGCVNPDHLEAVTQAVNIERCRLHVGKRTHCPHGHPYAGDNLVINAQGKRCCRSCMNLRSRQYYRRRHHGAA